MDNKHRLPFRRASFLKILKDDVIKKLPIPPVFVKIFEGDIPSWFILEIAGTRKCWRVDIEEDANGGLYIGCGFDCFVQAQSLEVGHVLLFKLEEPYILQVKLYNKDGSEKTEGLTFGSDYKFEAVESRQTPIIHQERESSPSPTMPFMALMDHKRRLPLRRASFLKVLEDDIIKRLPISPAFTTIFEGDIPSWFILEIAGTRKCWRVDIEEDGNGGLYLGCGFDCFVQAQSLKVGNLLLFELQEPSILQVKLYEKDGSEKTEGMSFRSNYEVAASESPRQTPKIHQEREASPWLRMPSDQYGAYEKPQNDSSGSKRKKATVSPTKHGLCFSVTWKKASHFIYYLTIPRAMLVGKTLSNKETVILKDREGNSWPVELRMRADGRVDLSRGWREFVKDNDLTAGDTLTLEFVSNNVIQVHVGRPFEVDNPSHREQHCKLEPTEYFNMACEKEGELAANFTIHNSAPVTMDKFESIASESKSSSFSITYTQRTRNSYLHIPKVIANKQKLENRDIVVLCDPEGRQWLMEVRTRASDGRVGLGRGWADFSKSYGIGVGDTLIFEFVTDRTMKVHVVKACDRLERADATGAMFKQEVKLL